MAAAESSTSVAELQQLEAFIELRASTSSEAKAQDINEKLTATNQKYVNSSGDGAYRLTPFGHWRTT